MRVQPSFKWVAALGTALGAELGLAQQTPPASPHAATSPSAARPAAVELSKAEGVVMLDYQVIRVADNPSIDLMGLHFLHRMNDWLYLGVGGYAPVFRGEYGGFMTLDVTAHAQYKIAGKLFADAGVSLGGGGGGRSVQQSKVLSGTGGFVKGYVGLGYELERFSVGANVSRMKFSKSAIDNTQLNLYVAMPFSYTIGPYARSGERFTSAHTTGAADDAAGENTFNLGLDNYRQIDPVGSRKDTINVADLQFSHFMTKRSYWFFSLGVGYHGLPLYNQILGGLGYRLPINPRLNVYGQLGLGSGGYAPESIDTGPGVVVYPKVSVEYMLDKNFGVAVSAGYLFAPKGTSRNHVFGAALNYHIHSGESGAAASGAGEGIYRGYRLSLSHETGFGVKSRGVDRDNIDMLSAQVDHVVDDHVYLPIRLGVAYNAYLGYPGYGELSAGVGVQNRFSKDDRLQFFGQVLVGTNVHGPIVKAGGGMNCGLGERLAIHAIVGQTLGLDRNKFRSSYAGLGVTYRFSVPSR